MSDRTLLELGNRDCPECGETKDRLSRHWSFCAFPSVDGDLRALLTGILLGGGSLQGNSDQTQHLLVQSTSEDLARWLFDELGWLAHSLRRETFDGEREPIYRVRTHSHTYLRRLRDDWYHDGDKRIQADASLTTRSARVWWALAGGLEWTGDLDSQVRGTFSAEADDRAKAIAAVLDAHDFESDRLDRRVCLFGDDLRNWLDWAWQPVPGVEHKWATDRGAYDLLRGQPLRSVQACPMCDSSQIRRRKTLSPPWRCSACKSEFSEPATRVPTRGNPIDRDEAVSAVRAAALEVGEPLSKDDYQSWRKSHESAPGAPTLTERWGWAEVCSLAGIDTPRAAQPEEYSPDAIRNGLQTASDEVDSQLTVSAYADWATGRAAPGPKVVLKRYESWRSACRDAGVSTGDVGAAGDWDIPQEDS